MEFFAALGVAAIALGLAWLIVISALAISKRVKARRSRREKREYRDRHVYDLVDSTETRTRDTVNLLHRIDDFVHDRLLNHQLTANGVVTAMLDRLVRDGYMKAPTAVTLNPSVSYTMASNNTTTASAEDIAKAVAKHMRFIANENLNAQVPLVVEPSLDFGSTWTKDPDDKVPSIVVLTESTSGDWFPLFLYYENDSDTRQNAEADAVWLTQYGLAARIEYTQEP